MARAKPVGGQIGLALGFSDASFRPNLARTKYKAATTTNSTTGRAVEETASNLERASFHGVIAL
jgi:hypothetical protein